MLVFGRATIGTRNFAKKVIEIKEIYFIYICEFTEVHCWICTDCDPELQGNLKLRDVHVNWPVR
jgi:hypothetical protein